MIEQSIILEIEKLLDNKKIIDSKLLSDSFGINCLKIVTSDSKEFIVKYYYKNNDEFNAIKSETDNLIFFNKQKFNYFPNIIKYNDKFLIMSFINNNNDQPKQTNNDFLNAIISIHSIKNQNVPFRVRKSLTYSNFHMLHWHNSPLPDAKHTWSLDLMKPHFEWHQDQKVRQFEVPILHYRPILEHGQLYWQTNTGDNAHSNPNRLQQRLAINRLSRPHHMNFQHLHLWRRHG